MNRIAAVALFALATLAPIASTSAQQLTGPTNIPFAFTVNGETLPAGSYVIGSILSSSPNVLAIRSTTRPIEALVVTRKEDKGNQAGATKLVFVKCGDQYFLHEIFSLMGHIDAVVPTSQQEKTARLEMAKAKAGQPTMVAINQGEGLSR